jgi:hypothetical protein
MTDTVKTWGQLEAEGVRRCCCMFKNGKRCRRRAFATFDNSWCEKHGPLMRAYQAHHKAVLEGMSGGRRHDDDDGDG